MILFSFRQPRDELIFWAAHTLFWAAAFAAGLIVVKAFVPDLPDRAWFVGSRAVVGFAVTALLHWLSARDDVRRRLGVSQAGLMLGGPLAGGALMTLVLAAVAWACAKPADSLGLMAGFVLNTIVLATWSALAFGALLLREGQSAELRTLQAESLAYKNELRLLQSQISPHFLFNALNTILACKHDPEAIETVTQSLAKYLRFLLQPSDTLEPLGREIDAIEEYLTIQSFRFGDRLSCRINCDADVRPIPVLPVMVQPLVENALKYGSPAEHQPLEIVIRAWREGARLFLEVANTGRWVAGSSETATGTGLHGLRRRLLLHAGPEATVTAREDQGWVRVLLALPLAPAFAAPRPLETAS